MPDDEINYEEIRQRVEQRFTQLKEWFMHAMIFAIFIVALALIFGSNKYVIGFLLLWLAGFAAHTVEVFGEFVTAGMQRRAIELDIEMEIYYRSGQMPSFMKQKREDTSQRLQLSDDGELIPVIENEDRAALDMDQQ